MLSVPIQATPSQTFSVTLGNQNCRINLYQRSTGLYCDLYVNDALIIGGVICLNANVIVRDGYLGFVGDLVFYDLQGGTDPVSTGLGARYILVYLEASDLVGAAVA
jgi:hypothetical protein